MDQNIGTKIVLLLESLIKNGADRIILYHVLSCLRSYDEPKSSGK